MHIKDKIHSRILDLKTKGTELHRLADLVENTTGEAKTIYTNKLRDDLKNYKEELKKLKEELEEFFVYEKENGLPINFQLRKSYRNITK